MLQGTYQVHFESIDRVTDYETWKRSVKERRSKFFKLFTQKQYLPLNKLKENFMVKIIQFYLYTLSLHGEKKFLSHRSFSIGYFRLQQKGSYRLTKQYNSKYIVLSNSLSLAKQYKNSPLLLFSMDVWLYYLCIVAQTFSPSEYTQNLINTTRKPIIEHPILDHKVSSCPIVPRIVQSTVKTSNSAYQERN